MHSETEPEFRYLRAVRA